MKKDKTDKEIDAIIKPHGNKKHRPARRVQPPAPSSKYDLIKEKIVNGNLLEKEEQEVFEKLMQVYEILSGHPSTEESAKLVAKAFDISRSAAFYWIQKSRNFFGEVDIMSVKTKRYLQEQRLLNIIENTQSDQIKIKAEKILMEVMGTNIHKSAEQLRRRRVRVVYTQNIDALKAEEITEEYE